MNRYRKDIKIGSLTLRFKWSRRNALVRLRKKYWFTFTLFSLEKNLMGCDVNVLGFKYEWSAGRSLFRYHNVPSFKRLDIFFLRFIQEGFDE